MQISEHASDGRFVGFARINAVDSLARQLVQNIGLPFPGYGAVAHECRQDLLVAEVLAPGLELLRRPAKLLSQCRQRLAEAMRIEIRQVRPCKRFLKDAPYRGRIAPAHPIEADSCKRPLLPNFELRSPETEDRPDRTSSPWSRMKSSRQRWPQYRHRPGKRST